MRTFAFGFLTGVGATLGGVYYLVTHADTVNNKLKDVAESLTDLADTVEAGDAVRKSEASYDSVVDPERQAEINAATPENPVALARDEINKMNPEYIRSGFASGRFTLESPS